MKKFLLTTLVTLLAFLNYTLSAQQCSSGGTPVNFSTGTKPPGFTGDGLDDGIANYFVTVNGNIQKWQDYIVGTFSGDDNDPYMAPLLIASNNWSKDGLKSLGDDRDNPQGNRDLRYFAYTYDNQNVYFYFRRVVSSTSQVAYFYICDVDADGKEQTGEPVIKVVYTNGGSASLEVGYYTAINAGGDPLTDADGFADGYNMPGSYTALPASILSQVTLVSFEVFKSADTEGGYGTEFSVPWKYFRNWISGGVPSSANTPLTYLNAFLYHVSSAQGNSGLNNASDNAGGCCGGVAIGGAPGFLLSNSSTSTINKFWQYSFVTTASNSTLKSSKTWIEKIGLTGAQYQSFAIDWDEVEVYVSKWDCNTNTMIGSEQQFIYNGLQPSGKYEYLAADEIALQQTAPTMSYDVCFRTRLVLPHPGDSYGNTNYQLKNFTATIYTLSEFTENVSPGGCELSNSQGTGDVSQNIETTLPAKIKFFNASKTSSGKVTLSWETLQEINMDGYEIQRKTNHGFETIGFVASKAPDGTSETGYTYNFDDNTNSYSGTSMYRLRLVDITAQLQYSEIRAVKGNDKSISITVYPNPNKGIANVVIPSGIGTMDLSVTDMTGRTIQAMNGIKVNNIQITNLNPGIYMLRINFRETGEQVSQKVIVQK